MILALAVGVVGVSGCSGETDKSGMKNVSTGNVSYVDKLAEDSLDVVDVDENNEKTDEASEEPETSKENAESSLESQAVITSNADVNSSENSDTLAEDSLDAVNVDENNGKTGETSEEPETAKENAGSSLESEAIKTPAADANAKTREELKDKIAEVMPQVKKDYPDLDGFLLEEMAYLRASGKYVAYPRRDAIEAHLIDESSPRLTSDLVLSLMSKHQLSLIRKEEVDSEVLPKGLRYDELIKQQIYPDEIYDRVEMNKISRTEVEAYLSYDLDDYAHDIVGSAQTLIFSKFKVDLNKRLYMVQEINNVKIYMYYIPDEYTLYLKEDKQSVSTRNSDCDYVYHEGAVALHPTSWQDDLEKFGIVSE